MVRNFLLRHEALLGGNQRVALPVRNLARWKPADRVRIAEWTVQIKANDGAPVVWRPSGEGLLKL